MELSRKMRKKEAAKNSARRTKFIILGLTAVLSLLAVWHMKNLLAFVIVTVIFFFGILNINLYNLKRFIPGLTTNSPSLKFMYTLIYLLMVMALISQICI
jgi:uncharacterized membrane protein